MRVLGIDPGSNCTGYGIIEKADRDLKLIVSGAIFVPTAQPMPQRLEKIYVYLLEVIDKFSPQVIALEDIFFAKNFKSALRLGQARGMALLAAAIKKIPVYEYSPLEVKQAVTGYGGAQKEQVQAMVKALLHLKEAPEPYDVADALAAAICHLNTVTVSPPAKAAEELV